MKLAYIIREGILGIRRSRYAFMISVFSVTLALVLIGIGVLAVDNGLQYIGDLQPDYDLEVFLNKDASNQEQRDVATSIKEYPGVIRSEYLSKEDAAAIYNAEFGEDVLSLLEDNPLPSSFRVTFEDQHRTGPAIQSFIISMEYLSGVDEVIFKKDLFERVQGILQSIYLIAAAGIFIIILFSVFMTANNLRLMILARFDYIETVRLLGAGDFMVKAPFFFEGGILGFIGGLLAVLAIAGFEWGLRFLHIIDLPVNILSQPEFMLGTILFGISIASLGVLKAVRKMLRFVS